MKTAIIYYSMTGNTDYVAKILSDKTGADLIKIEPKKEYPNKGLRKFIWGGKSAVMGETPALEPYEFDGGTYDYIIFGTPVWASSFAPPIRTFIKENKETLSGKKFAVFLCYMGGGADKAVEKLEKYLEIDSFEAQLILIEPKENETEENKEKIEEFCKKISG